MHYRSGNPGRGSTIGTACGQTVPVDQASAWLHKVTCGPCKSAQKKKTKAPSRVFGRGKGP